MLLGDENGVITPLRILDLETALLDDCSADILYGISKGKNIPESLRAEVWQVCLDVQDKGNQLVLFNEIFDLPEQNLLRDDCQKVVANLGNEDEDKVSVVSDLESILTFYCKSSGVQYEQGNGWIEILLPLISLKLPRSDTYNLFEAIKHRYIPRGCKKNGVVFHVFRLLLLYHDPELCSFLDTMRISPDLYCLSWFQSLFAATCGLPVGLCMWDLYFQKADPFFVFFLALVMIVNARISLILDNPGCIDREQILSMKNDSKQTLVDTLSAMPCALEADDVTDFCSLAQYYDLKTPSSFKEMLQEPAAFLTAVQGLLSAQRQALAARSAAGGEHLCFLGSGRVEEDQYTHMVVASFLQKHTHFVSMVSGGYKAIHEYFGKDARASLEDHNPQSCVICSPDSTGEGLDTGRTNSTSVDIFGKIRANKRKQAELASVLIKPEVKAIPRVAEFWNQDLWGWHSWTRPLKLAVERTGGVLPCPELCSLYPSLSRWQSSVPVACYLVQNCVPCTLASQVGSRAYRWYSTSVASPEEDEHQEVVSISTWLGKPEVVMSFNCHEVKVNGYMYDSHLLVTDSHVYVLRDLPGKRGFAHIVVRRPLSAIVKITSKKKHPELITFKYGVPEGEELVISDMDRFLIPEASKATGIISQQILKHLKSKEG
uniref:Rab-GAP TBC domain-containing protein n=1 Tax=Timema shepardi TaxID=629360 RepID=A0A7R9ARF5_TIMSH|nr:unnamed protein product [Timema shepardi]